MRSCLVVTAVALLLSAASAFAAGPWQPPMDWGCEACTFDRISMVVECEAAQRAEDQRWNPCNPSLRCECMPGGGCDCYADCGGTRCYYV